MKAKFNEHSIDKLKLKRWTSRRLRKAGIININQLIGISHQELKEKKLNSAQINEVFQKLRLFRSTTKEKINKLNTLLDELSQLQEADSILDKQIIMAEKKLKKGHD